MERRYQLLLEISQRVRGSLDLGDVLGHLLDALHTAVAYDAGGVFVLNRVTLPAAAGDPRQEIAAMVQRGYDPHPVDHDLMLMRGAGIVGHAIRTGEPVRAPDVRLDAHYVVGRERTRSEVAVPLMGAGEAIGALNLESDRLDAFSTEDVELLRLFADAATACIDRAMLHHQVIERRKLEDQMRLAHEVQSRLLPAAAPLFPGFDIAGTCIPCFAIGGDYFDFIPLDDDCLSVVVADVSGKGIPAALSMTGFRSVLRSQARRRRDPSHLANRVNALLPDTTGDTAYVTCVYGVLDRRDACLTYTNCGHNPPLLVRSDGAIELLERGGLPLGIFTDSRYETGVTRLEPGDTLLLYTDGVVESADPDGELLGSERLSELLRRSRHLPAAALVDTVVRETRAFSRCETFPDDLTVVVLRRPPAG